MATLYIVSTPIGNLSDASPRMVETLKKVDHIACEDTRTSSKLLNHFGIDTPMFPFHQHNEHRKVHHLMNILQGGESVALISDAGMPGISDPGFLAVRDAWKNGHSVSVIPGPDAITTALVVSGMPSDRFAFEGFLPHKKGRQKRLKALVEEDRTIVIYESPNRLLKLLDELNGYAGEDRLVAVCRELTKNFEEVNRGTVQQVLNTYSERESIKGEIVVVLSPKSYSE